MLGDGFHSVHVVSEFDFGGGVRPVAGVVDDHVDDLGREGAAVGDEE